LSALISPRIVSTFTWPAGLGFRCRAHARGHQRIDRQDRPHDPSLIVLEATGGLETIVVAALAGAAVNPRQIRDFAPPQASWPRPTPSTRRRSRGSHKPSGRSRASCRAMRPGRWLNWSRAAAR
jgi:hypothetical protein